MGRLLFSGADGNVSGHLVNALVATGHHRGAAATSDTRCTNVPPRT